MNNIKRKLLFIAGPCVIENEEMTLQIADTLCSMVEKRDVQFVFKASYDKANRTSLKSYRGPGLSQGLDILQKVKDRFNVSILTDVHSTCDVKAVCEVADIIQIPAFLCRQTDLLIETARHAKTINVKKAQFMAPWDIKAVVDKIVQSGNTNIILTERGTCFGYNRLVVDMCSIPIMQETGFPVVIDATHSVQLPSMRGTQSGGNPEYILTITRAAIAAGCDGVFLEVHPNPCKALCDSASSFSLDKVEKLLDDILRIY